jgi:hypothetical protein
MWSDWKLNCILIVILPYYKNGTSDGMDVGKDGFPSGRNEGIQQKDRGHLTRDEVLARRDDGLPRSDEACLESKEPTSGETRVHSGAWGGP